MSADSRIRPYNFSLALAGADTEFEFFAVDTWIGGTAPITSLAGLLGLSFQLRGNFDLRFAFETGKVAASTPPFLTLKAGTVFNAPEKLSLKGISTIYFACSTATQVVEGIAWLRA